MNAIDLKRALAAGEHAAFLWNSRGALAHSSAVTFDALARFDNRLSRLIDKLSQRHGLAEQFLHELPAVNPGVAFVTAIMALRDDAAEVFEELLARLESDQSLLSPLASALTWLEYSEVRKVVKRLLVSSSHAQLHLGIVTAVAHHVDPGVALERGLAGEASALRASALEAIGRLALADLQPQVHAALADEDPRCRFFAAWSAVRCGQRAGIPVLGRFAADCGPFARPACDLALRALDPEKALRAHSRLSSLNARLGVVAAGIVGDSRLVPWLLDSMEALARARAAGAAFCLMTGRDLRRDDLDVERPLSAAASDEAAADVAASQPNDGLSSQGAQGEAFFDEPDDDLVWPDVARLRAWWNENRRRFSPGIRYLAGMPIRPAALTALLRTGNQQQRAAAALELALLRPDTPLVDVAAPAHRQLGTRNPSVQ